LNINSGILRLMGRRGDREERLGKSPEKEKTRAGPLAAFWELG
jgi:hypothetical protein